MNHSHAIEDAELEELWVPLRKPHCAKGLREAKSGAGAFPNFFFNQGMICSITLLKVTDSRPPYRSDSHTTVL